MSPIVNVEYLKELIEEYLMKQSLFVSIHTILCKNQNVYYDFKILKYQGS